MKREDSKGIRLPPKRVMLVDDHPMTRDGIAQLIGLEPDLEVVCQVGTAGEALNALLAKAPDLALVDITLPDRSGIELIKDFHVLRPEMRILVVSMHDESLYAVRALRAGAQGYISKQEGGVPLINAVRRVLADEISVSEKVRSQILDLFSGKSHRSDVSPLGKLTDREIEVLQLIGRGLETKEIANWMKISKKTVEAHRLHIKSKLNLTKASELIAFAARSTEL